MSTQVRITEASWARQYHALSNHCTLQTHNARPGATFMRGCPITLKSAGDQNCHLKFFENTNVHILCVHRHMRTYVYALSFMLYLAVQYPNISYHTMPCRAMPYCSAPHHNTHTHYNARSHTYKTIKKSKAQSHTCMRAHIQEVEVVKIENEAFVLGIPQKIKKGRCEKEAFVLDRPLKLKVECENDAFARDVLQKLTTSSWQSDA